MGDRARELDVTHALPAHLGDRHLHPALFADHSAMLETLVLPAQALVVLVGPEYLGAEESVTLRLERAVVDRFRLLDLAEGPGSDLVRRRQSNTNGIEDLDLTLGSEKIQKVFHGFSRVVFERSLGPVFRLWRLVMLELDIDSEGANLLHEHVE